MADKVSFTDFGAKKKVRKVKRGGPKKATVNAEELLDEVLTAKKIASKAIEESSSNLVTLPFIEFSALQVGQILVVFLVFKSLRIFGGISLSTLFA